MQLGEGGQDDDEGWQVAVEVFLASWPCSSEKVEKNSGVSPGLAALEGEKLAVDDVVEDGVHKRVAAVKSCLRSHIFSYYW